MSPWIALLVLFFLFCVKLYSHSDFDLLYHIIIVISKFIVIFSGKHYAE